MISFDAVSHATSIGSSPITWTHTCGVSAQLFIVTGQYASAVTYNSVNSLLLVDYTPQPLISPPSSNSCPRIKIWYVANPASGAHTVSVTTTDPLDCGAISFLGMATNQPDVEQDTDTTKQQNANTQTGSVVGTVTTVKNNDWVVGFGIGGNNVPQTWTNHSGSTLRYGGLGSILADAIFIVDSNGPVAIGSNSVGGDWNVGTGFNTLVTLGLAQISQLSGQPLII